MLISRATEFDYNEILDYLEGDGFYYNLRNLGYEDLYVYRDESGNNVGFILGPPSEPGVLYVKDEYRRKGVGRALAEYMISKAKEEDCCVIRVQCKPLSSTVFWKQMDFTVPEESHRQTVYAYRTIPKAYKLPAKNAVDVSIAFFPQNRENDDKVKPLMEAFPIATYDDDGTVILRERVIFVRDLYPESMDVVVSVTVDGHNIHCAKAKYVESERLGVRKQGMLAYYIDTIIPLITK